MKLNLKINRLKNETRDKAINMAVVPVNVGTRGARPVNLGLSP